MTKGLTMRLIPALMMFGFAGIASASGFALQNQTGSNNGNAFAGAAATAQDAGTVYWNPAGMTYLGQGHSISASGTILDRSIKFKNTGTTPVTIGGSYYGNTSNGGDAGGASLLPSGYWAYSVAPDVWFGVGVSPTFGNKTEYNKNFIGKYAGYMTEIETININPSFAIKVNEMLSLGLGIDFSYAKLHLKQGLPVAPANAATNYYEVESDGNWGVGANIGAMFQLSPSTRVGVTYRSQIDYDVTGKQTLHPNLTAANFTAIGLGAGAAAAAAAQFSSQKVKAQGYTTPASFSTAVSQKLSDRWEMLGDVTWTGWGILDTLEVQNKNANLGGAIPAGTNITTLSYDFKNTWAMGLGANYTYSDAWLFRFGTRYDQTPVRGKTDRTMTLPDSDRIWLSFGGKYTLSKEASIDFGYSHIFFQDVKTSRAVNVGTSTVQTVRGEWDSNRADILSVQYNHKF